MLEVLREEMADLLYALPCIATFLSNNRPLILTYIRQERIMGNQVPIIFATNGRCVTLQEWVALLAIFSNLGKAIPGTSFSLNISLTIFQNAHFNQLGFRIILIFFPSCSSEYIVSTNFSKTFLFVFCDCATLPPWLSTVIY